MQVRWCRVYLLIGYIIGTSSRSRLDYYMGKYPASPLCTVYIHVADSHDLHVDCNFHYVGLEILVKTCLSGGINLMSDNQSRWRYFFRLSELET